MTQSKELRMCGQKSEDKRKSLRKWKDAKVAVIFRKTYKCLIFSWFHWIFFLIVYHTKTSKPNNPVDVVNVCNTFFDCSKWYATR